MAEVARLLGENEATLSRLLKNKPMRTRTVHRILDSVTRVLNG